MQVAEAMEILCQKRRFHAIIFLLMALNFMYVPIHIFVDLFLSYEPHHYCAFPPGGSKYAWIPYNHATHEFYECAIYETPLTKELEQAEKKRIEHESYMKDVKVWDWKSLKFKTKKHKYHGQSNHAHNVGHSDDVIHSSGESSSSDAHRRRRREQARAQAQKQAGNAARFVTEDGELVPPPTSAGSSENSEPPRETRAELLSTPREEPGEGASTTEAAHQVDEETVPSSTEATEQNADTAEDSNRETRKLRINEHDEEYAVNPADDEHADDDDDTDDEHDDHHGDVIVSHWKDDEHFWPEADDAEEDRESQDDDKDYQSDRSDTESNSKSGGDSSHKRDKFRDKEKSGKAGDPQVHVAASSDAKYGTTPNPYEHTKFLHKVQECQHGIHYQANVGTTLATEYGLSCKKDVSVITNTVLGTAMVAGAIIFAPFVDKYGRKTLFMMVCCQNTLISLGIAFVGDIRSYWVLRFLSRFYIEGVEIAILVLAVEMAPTKSRPIAPLVLYVAYAIGQVLLSLQAMLFRSWWKLQLAISVETMLLIPFSWFLMPESIQWLVSMRRNAEAEKLIRLGCRLNGTILPSDFTLDKVADDDDAHGGHGHGHDHDEEATGNGYHGTMPRKSAVERLRHTQLNLKNRPGTGEYLQHEFHAHIGDWRKVIDLMKNRQLRRHFFIVSYMWAVVGFLYYGLTASTMVMKGNVYLNYCLSGLVMIPASVSIFILRRFGRKKPIFYFLIGAGIFIILSVVCPPKTPDGVDMYPVYLAVKLMAKYCVVSCLISIRLLIIELFPTPVRGTLIGLTAFIGLLGSAFGYYFLEMISFSKWVGVAVGALALIAAGLSRLLPETSHRPLPDTINDMMAACREMFLNLLVAMPNVPKPEEPPPPTPQPRPKRNMSALSAFSAVLSWRTRSKSGNSDTAAPARSMSDEDFKRPPHLPLSSQMSAPPPNGRRRTSSGGPSMRSLVQRVKDANLPATSPPASPQPSSSSVASPRAGSASPRPSLREKLARALSTRRPEGGGGGNRLDVPADVAPRPRRCSSTPSLSAADKQKLGIINQQYQPDEDGSEPPPKVTFDLVRRDSSRRSSVASRKSRQEPTMVVPREHGGCVAPPSPLVTGRRGGDPQSAPEREVSSAATPSLSSTTPATSPVNGGLYPQLSVEEDDDATASAEPASSPSANNAPIVLHVPSSPPTSPARSVADEKKRSSMWDKLATKIVVSSPETNGDVLEGGQAPEGTTQL